MAVASRVGSTHSYEHPSGLPTQVSNSFRKLRLRSLEVGDTKRVIAYYEDALDHLGQVNCCRIAKIFITHIEPRKKTTYPYNGVRRHNMASSRLRANPEETRPPWWPAGVRYKEPDHLLKKGRLVSPLPVGGADSLKNVFLS